MEQGNKIFKPEISAPDEETAWAVLCDLIGKDKAARFCRAFVRGGKVRISSRKFFMFADVIGAVAAQKIVDTFDGEQATLPSLPGIGNRDGNDARDSAIRKNKGRISQKDLAQIAGLSTRQIKRIQNERKQI